MHFTRKLSLYTRYIGFLSLDTANTVYDKSESCRCFSAQVGFFSSAVRFVVQIAYFHAYNIVINKNYYRRQQQVAPNIS